MTRLALLLSLVVVGCTNDYDQFAFTDDGGTATGGGGGASGGSAGTSGAGGSTGGTAGTGGTTAASCQDLFGNAQGVVAVCDDQPTSCDLRYNAHVATCTEICQAAGATCDGVFNNAGPCGHGQPADCGTSQFSSAICVCKR